MEVERSLQTPPPPPLNSYSVARELLSIRDSEATWLIAKPDELKAETCRAAKMESGPSGAAGLHSAKHRAANALYRQRDVADFLWLVHGHMRGISPSRWSLKAVSHLCWLSNRPQVLPARWEFMHAGKIRG